MLYVRFFANRGNAWRKISLISRIFFWGVAINLKHSVLTGKSIHLMKQFLVREILRVNIGRSGAHFNNRTCRALLGGEDHFKSASIFL